MAVKYSTVQRRNMLKPNARPKFYAQAKSRGKVTLRTVASDISEISTVSKIDSVAVIEALLTVIPKYIADGNIVKLRDFGTFSLTVKSEGVENEADFRSSNIKGYSLHFRPGKEFKDVLDKIEYEKL